MPITPGYHVHQIKPIKYSTIIIVFVVMSSLSGCASIDRNILAPAADASRVPPLIRTEECSGFDYTETLMRNPFWRNPCEIQKFSLKVSEVNTAMNSECPEDITSIKDNKAMLRECAAYLEVASDKICTVHLSKIFGNRAVTNATLGIVASGAGIAGGLVSGTAANALSGSSGFLTADRSILNEEIYRNYVAEAIIKEIIDNRNNLKNSILADIVAGPDSASAILGPQELLQRVLEYHNNCSFYAGLTSLIGKAGNSGQRASDVKKNLDDQIATLKAVIQDLDEEIGNETDAGKKSDLKAKRQAYRDQLLGYQTARNSITYVASPVKTSSNDSNGEAGENPQ